MTSFIYSEAKFVVVAAIVILTLSVYLLPRNKNNVCTSFSDYYGDRDSNKNCYYNPEAKLNVSQIIRGRGYTVEEHHVITKDGYILTLFRIPHPKNSLGISGPPVFLQHGAVVNSASFINRGSKSLGFILADEGYDVWLGNFRGTTYSKRHTHIKHTDRRYWHFDTYELGVYDTSANIDYIHEVTGQSIIYIGHSLGSTTGYIYGVTSPEIAKEKLKIIISLAPTLYVKNWKSLTRYIFGLWSYASPLIAALTNEEIYLRGRPGNPIRESLCTRYPFQMYYCQFFEMATLGFDYEQNDPETLPVTLLQNADAISFRTLTHCIQLVLNGTLAYFDHGAETNLKVYGSIHPPQYDLSQLKVPTYLIRALNDLIITKEDVEYVHKMLPNGTNPYDIYTVEHQLFNHEDFLTARDVVPLLYNHLITFMNKL
ncbi:hypothetical protein PPYR_07348 [Photinus pyralis]|uniref:Lipase n=1 Tax=Photinus pyralis TaxID=7054 RepID=A0A5N4AQI1_PHOPY|nr:lipase member K-like [Photinus pyralis]XP_031339041.1 lipase member K-like [Photinus pyralis]KAB0799468.1 hypothetical protein PPYR_07348 [Photinus pyralis]